MGPAWSMALDQSLVFDAQLIRRYDRQGPRYTSYPTAVQFHEGFGETDYRRHAAASNAELIPRPLSLYFHIPFCNTVCFYCGCSKVVTRNRGRAAPYLERLHREIRRQAELFDPDRTVDQLHWGGGTPTFISHEQMRELMWVTSEHFRLREDPEREYGIEIDPREVGEETLEVLAECGFNRISLGVQDVDPDVQKAVNRIQPVEVTRAVIEEARRQGFGSISLDLIYGLPFQDRARFDRTLETVLEMAPDRLAIYNYAHLPELFRPQRRIRAEDLPSPAEKLAILQSAIDLLTRAGYVYIGMDHFARPDNELAVAQRDGRLYRNFQGYSTHAGCDLIGMGMTSISQVGDCYSQNAKGLEDYCRRIDDGGLAVVRGLELNAEDRLRREVITSLICNFGVSYAEVEERHGIDFARHFAGEIRRLREMEADGLLEIGAEGIEVRPVGRLLIRNICMVFDAYLQPASGQRFSRTI